MAKLENVSAEYLREVWESVDDEKAAKRLAPAIAYKEVDGLTQTEAAAMFGFSSGWASIWFDRLERLADEPFEDVLVDRPRSGRPTELSRGQRETFESVLQEPPEAAGLDAPAWTVHLARQYLRNEFGVDYSTRHTRRLMRDAGLSWERVPEDSRDGRSPGQDGAGKRRTVWTTPRS